jgi:hypothetical protein
MVASEDAFDAACTALVMAAHATSFTRLHAPRDDPFEGIARREGWVWSPTLPPAGAA